MARRAALITAIAAGVLLAHWAALEWAARQWHRPASLRPLATPMFTRLLQPQAAAPLPPLPSVVAVRPAVRAITAAAPLASRAASAPPPVRPEASPAPPEPPVRLAEPEAETPPSDVELGLGPQPQLDVRSGNAPAPTLSASAAVAAASAASPSGTPASGAAALPTAAASAPALAASAAAGSADAWPADTRLSYRLSGQYRGELHGDARVQWQRRADRYEVRIDVDVGALASLRMISQGEVTPQGLRPRAYEETRNGRGRSMALGEQALALADGRQMPRPEGVQDTASQFVELAYRFASGREALAEGRAVSFWMMRPGAADLWTYDVVERVALATPQLGTVEAFHLKPRPLARPRGNITAEMWFAPSLQYLPVRIRINMGEDVYVDLLVDKIEQR